MIHQLPPPPIEFAEPKSAAVKLAGGGLVRMEEGKGTRWHETPPACQVYHRAPAAYSRARIPVAGDTESACPRDRAFIGLRVVGLAAALERSKYAGLLPFPFLLPWERCQTWASLDWATLMLYQAFRPNPTDVVLGPGHVIPGPCQIQIRQHPSTRQNMHKETNRTSAESVAIRYMLHRATAQNYHKCSASAQKCSYFFFSFFSR